MVAARSLRYRVEVQDSTYTTDARGGHTETWATTSERWANITPLSGRELFFAQLENRKVSHRIELRMTDLDPQKQRIKYGDRIFQVVHVKSPLPRNRRMMELMAVE